MKHILIALMFLTGAILSHTYGYPESVSTTNEEIMKQRKKYADFKKNLKHLARQYECNNTQIADDETEAMDVCAECTLTAGVSLFSDLTSWIYEQQDDILEPCENIDPQLIEEEISKMVLFPIRVILPEGRVRTIGSAEDFQTHLPSILNSRVLHAIQDYNFEDIWITMDENREHKISFIKTPN